MIADSSNVKELHKSFEIDNMAHNLDHAFRYSIIEGSLNVLQWIEGDLA